MHHLQSHQVTQISSMHSVAQFGQKSFFSVFQGDLTNRAVDCRRVGRLVVLVVNGEGAVEEVALRWVLLFLAWLTVVLKDTVCEVPE